MSRVSPASVHWEEQGEGVVLSERARGVGCIYIVFGLIGIVLVLGALIVLLAEAESGELSVPAVFATMFGLLFAVGGFSGHRNRFDGVTTVSSAQRTVRFERAELPAQVYSFAEIVRLHVKEKSGNRETGTRYRITLELRDGSRFWLESPRKKDIAREHAARLQSLIGCPLTDKADLGLEVAAPGPREPEDAQSVAVERGDAFARWQADSQTEQRPFVRVEREGGQLRIQLRRRPSILRAFLMALTVGIFAGLPVWLLVRAVGTAADDPGGWLAVIFLGPFATIFVGVVLMVVFLQARRYVVSVRPSEMTLAMRLPFGLFQSTIRVPRDAVRAIRVHRHEGGHFRLVVGVDRTLETPRGPLWLLMNLGALANSFDDDEQDERTVRLWEASGFENPKDGPSYADLYAVEAILKDTMGLSEEL